MIAVDRLDGSARAIHAAIAAANAPTQLDDLSRSMWLSLGAGNISDAEAEFLDACIAQRRPARPDIRSTAPKPITATLSRAGSRLRPRKPQRSPDRAASCARRREAGGSGAMPNMIRSRYTEGQRAVLTFVAIEVKRQGYCDWPIDKIAACAGVCRTTAQTAMHEARRNGDITITERPQRGRKSLTNIVRISGREWLAWLKRGLHALGSIGSNSFTEVSPTKSSLLKTHAFSQAGTSRWALREAQASRSRPLVVA